ncbi:hypothetical protein B296_00013087 [Ensete ventricosum]|uniref:START domain-containing protein n=1 Tax=Ensete ventricosum TaxID=4639 RepID=A0A426ZI52_ENSVE|nr:hypothetical protein B296_00013087 [Ensete ventricosum]
MGMTIFYGNVLPQVDRVSDLASKYLGRPITQLPSLQRVPIAQSEVSVGTYYNPGISSSLDLGLLCQSSSSVLSYPSPTTISDLEKPIMMEMASAALEEVVKLIQTNEPLWLKSASNGTEVLQSETYERIFQRPSQQFKFSDTRTEASRDSALVIMDAATLVDMFMDAVSMYEELQVLSPVVPTRHFCFLRYCQQIDPDLWVIADVSVNYPMDSRHLPSPLSCKLPSGCLIEAMPNGYSKRTDSSLPHGVVLSAATSIWLPLPRDRVFGFLKDEQNRPQVALQLHIGCGRRSFNQLRSNGKAFRLAGYCCIPNADEQLSRC